VLRAMEEQGKGLKAALYDDKQRRSDVQKVCGLVCAVLRHKQLLIRVLDRCGLIDGSANHKKSKTKAKSSSPVDNRYLCLAMAQDMLFGRGIRGGGGVKRALEANQTELRAALADEENKGPPPPTAADSAVSSLPSKRRNASQQSASKRTRGENGAVVSERRPGDAADSGGAVVLPPRYVRVNGLVGGKSGQEIRSLIQAQMRKAKIDGDVETDPYIPSLLVLPSTAGALLAQNKLVHEGNVILQDRSSCLAALAADIRPGDTVLDACAAPGSKTLHCLDFMKGSGHLVACERAPRRAVTLLQRLRDHGGFDGPLESLSAAYGDSADKRSALSDLSDARAAERQLKERDGKPMFFRHTNYASLSVEVRVADFLSLRSADVSPDVILVDPSCSGSGLPTHQMDDQGGGRDVERLQKLAAVQTQMLNHALTAFATARTVCYSTCSTHEEENEQVVAASLETIEQHKASSAAAKGGGRAARRFRLVSAVPWWPSTGVPEELSNAYAWGSKCVRCDPAVHRCRGFFLAKFVRKR